MKRLLSILLLCWVSYCCHAKTAEISVNGDKVSLSYEVRHDGDRYTISFNNVSFELTQATKQKYARKELCLVLFDRIGKTDVNFEGVEPEAFKIPADVGYEKSDKGYYVIESGTRLSFRMSETNNVVLKFPIYLACQERKKRYELVEKFSSLRVPINVNTVGSPRVDSPSANVAVSPIAKNSGITDEGERDVARRVKKFEMQLDDQDKLPFSAALESEYYELKVLKDEVDNAELARSINKVLKAYDEKKEDLELQTLVDAQAAKDEAERIEQQRKAEEQAEIEAEKAEAERKAAEAEKKAKKRTIWMIIGGAILSVLGFIGNQFSHHFRNLRNQRSMMEIQESLTRRAESEARRRAGNAVRSTANRAINSTIGKSRDAVREKVRSAEKKIKDKTKNKISNKKISI